MSLSGRPTPDLVVLGILFIVGTILILGIVAIIAIELLHPETDTDPWIEVESEILAVLVGAVVGFVGGRQVGRSETNGD